MYKIIIHPTTAVHYYSLTLASEDNSHFINIYISVTDDNIFINISKSEDGLFYKSPCEEGSNLKVEPSDNPVIILNEIKKNFLDQGYTVSIN